jgi:ribosomal protein L40E
MSDRSGPRGAALTVLILWTLTLGGLVGAFAALAPTARAGVCDQVGGVITGDWTITTAQTCSGIVYTVDGTININAAGSLTLADGGLRFAKDEAHQGHALNVNAGGALVLENSFVTTQTNAIDPYLHLAVTVSSSAGNTGSLTMRNGAYFKFPGWFNATGVAGTPAVLNLTDATITGFVDAELGGLGLDTDANNDAPLSVWTQTSASLYRVRYERLYEAATGGADVVLSASTSLHAYDTYLGVDHSDLPAKHNELTVDATSSAYLYNVTIDTTQNPAARADWEVPFRPAAGGNVYVLRWAHVTVTDSVGAPVAEATIWSRLGPSSTTAQYPDNGFGTTPSQRTLWYLGRTSSGTDAWNRTDGSGEATIPLYTDRVDVATLPNAESFGSYDMTAAYGASTAPGTASFPAYPSLQEDDNNRDVLIAFGSIVVCPSAVTTWDFTQSITGVVSVSRSIEVSGQVTITDGGIFVDQDASACAYIRVLSGGRLTLVNSTVSSNFRLTLDVVNGGTLVASEGSRLLLTARSVPGHLRSTGTTASVTVTDAWVDGNVALLGGSVTLVRDTFLGPGLTIDSDQRARLWDATLLGVSTLNLLTDDGNTGTVDLDVRNTTFDDDQTGQLVFRGSQNVQLTSVTLFDPDGTWWQSMITEGATISRYWWLTIRAVDGTGTLLADANVTIDLERMDPVLLRRFRAPNPAADDIYYAATTTWPVQAPDGFVVYRAFQESRTSSPSGRVVNNSYFATGEAFLDLTTYDADGPAQAAVTSDTQFDLHFSSLTPDLTVVEIQVSGGNGPLDTQPINTNITLTAVVRNSGQINVQNVVVAFFADDVDKNLDGLMDFDVTSFRSVAGIGGDVIIPVVPKNGTANAVVVWTPIGALETSRTVSAVVDPPVGPVTDGGRIRETNELNNIRSKTLTLFTWPDLAVGSADVTFLTDPVVNNAVVVRVAIQNEGTNRATDATVQLFEGATPQSSLATFSANNGATAVVMLTWTPTAVRLYNLEVRVTAKADSIRNTDYKTSNNIATVPKTVLTPPDLELRASDYTEPVDATQSQSFQIIVRLYNVGQTPAQNVAIAVYFDSTRSLQLGRATDVSVANFTDVTITVGGINVAGTRALLIVADPDNTLNEGGAAQESNNFANVTVVVAPPQGTATIGTPTNGTVIEPGVQFVVSGVVRDQNLAGIPSVALNIEIRDAANNVVTNQTTFTGPAGTFTVFFASATTNTFPDGAYRVVVTSPGGFISSTSASFSVQRTLPFLLQPVPLLRIQWWLFLVIVGAVAGIVLGATLYFKFYGLGKMVECGECGAFIPEDVTSCPKCGVEFEKDMAKCSNCQAWIPVDVKRCPECGVEFATGEVEMADYQEKMRLQYDEVVAKFKEEAGRQLGRSLSDREFQEWWRKQPTFLTFEDWLREEEEMRKMGSKPCPVCGTLNSVTATVCHKCGSLMKETRPPSGGGGGAGAVPPAAVRRTQPAPGPTPSGEQPPAGTQAPPTTPGAPGQGPEGLPRRVIRKPITPAGPVVQKRIIKRPPEPGQSGQTEQTSSGQSEQTSETKEDEA